jgi:bacterioferritin-associated ferredoxin
MRTELALAAPLDLTQMLATCGRGEVRGNLISLDRPGEMRWLVEQDGTPCMAGAAADDRANLPSFERLESWLAAAAVTWQTLSGLESAINGSPLICTCFEIREDAIRDCMASGAVTAAALGEALGCGTCCGSCLPELNSIVAKARPTPADTV